MNDTRDDKFLDDKFLLKLRDAPRPEFAEALFERISRQGGGRMLFHLGSITLKPMVKYAAALCLTLALISAASPSVRADVMRTIGKVGGFTYEERGRGWDAAQHPTPVQKPQQSRRVGLAEARKQVPYTFGLPTWLPAETTLKDDATEVAGTSVIVYYWSNDHQQNSFVWRTYQGQGGTGLVGKGSTETVTVNGESALLIRGIWDGRTAEWSRPNALTLHWFQDGVTYEIYADTNIGISVDDLIHIAESKR